MPDDFLTEALRYHALGWSVIPLQPRDKVPIFAAWQRYGTERSTEEAIRYWWGKTPTANIGLVTGPASGVFALDIDGDAGRQSVEGKTLPVTPTTKTKSGTHRLFKHPGAKVRNRVRFLPGLDIRGDGGQVVVPPSVHPDGPVYEWLVPPDEVAVAEAPEWLLAYAVDKPGSKAPAKTNSDGIPLWMQALHMGVQEGGRNEAIANLAGHYFGLGLPDEEVLAICLSINAAKLIPPLDVEEVERTVVSIGSAESRKRASRSLIEPEGDGAVIEPEGGSGERRRLARDAAGQALDLEITEAIKYRTDPPSYELKVAGVRVRLHSIEDMIEQRRLRNRIADEVGVMIPVIGKDRWPRVAQTLLDACEERAVEEGTEFGQLREWIHGYLEDTPPLPEVDTTDLAQEQPYIDKQGAVLINARSLRFWIKHRWGEDVHISKLTTMLRSYHSTPRQVNRRPATRRYWVLPVNLLPPHVRAQVTTEGHGDNGRPPLGAN